MEKTIIVRGKTFNGSHRPGYVTEYTPFCFQLNGKEYFIRNLETPNGKEKTLGNKRSRSEIAALIRQLRKNDFKWYRNYAGTFNTPFELIEYVKENNKHFERHGQFFVKSKTGNFTDFHGNLHEVSCAFSFRIYDQEYLEQVKKEFEGAKVKIHY